MKMSTTLVSTTTVCMTTTTISTIVFQGLNLPVRPQTTCSFTLLNMLHENQATKKVIFSNSALIHTHTRTIFVYTISYSVFLSLSLSYTHSLQIIEKEQEVFGVYLDLQANKKPMNRTKSLQKTYFEPCLIF